MSLLSGRHPHRQDCWTNSDALASAIPTFAHALGAAGYRATLVGRLHSIGPDQLHGYAERRVGDHSTNWIGGQPHSLGPPDRTNEPFAVSIERSGPGQSSYEVKDHDVTTAALACLDEIAARRAASETPGEEPPFALSVGYILPHQPYVCAPEDFARYAGRLGPAMLAAPEHEHPYLGWWRAHTGCAEVPEADAIRARTAYYGLVTAFDRMVGRILDRLEEAGLADNTLVIYTSDHGDQIGERGLWWKQTFYDESVKVPLLLSWPGHLPAGERRGQIVNLVDLAPSLIEAAGGPALPDADGRSLLGLARDGAAPWLDETVSEYCTDGMSRWTGATPVQQRMIRAGRWKLNYYHGTRPQLFDLEADPNEMNDLAEAPATAALRDDLVRRVLAGWDPEKIARRMARRRRNKELLHDWAHAVGPAESYQWRIRMEDNWLSGQAAQ